MSQHVATPTTVTRLAAPPVARPVPLTRRLLAGAVVVAPTMIGVNSLFHPEVDMTAVGILAGAVTDPTGWFSIHLVAAFGALLGVPAAFGLRTLARDRGRRLATAGAALTAIASPLLALAFAAEASVLRLAAQMEPAAGLALAEAYTGTPEFYAVGGAVALGTLASLLMGAALLVSRTVPRWLAGTYVAAVLATLGAVPGTAIGPVAFGVMALASVGLAIRIVRRRPPVTEPRPATSHV